MGAVTPCPGTSGPLSDFCPGVGACVPLSPGHVVPSPPAELRHRASPWQRNLGYPLAMLGLLALTVSVPPEGAGARPCPPPQPPSLPPCSSQGISVLIVCFHVLELLLDDAAMPRGIQVPGWGNRGQRGAVSHAGLGTVPPQRIPSSPGRMRPWARSPSPSSVPLELPCRSSSSCILQAGTRVPSAVPKAIPPRSPP